MMKYSRQMIGFDATSLISIVWLVVILGVYLWFYRTIKRIEQTLVDIKKVLESKSSTAR